MEAEHGFGTFTNSGTITSHSTAVYSDYAVGALTNNGLINSAEGYAIYVDDKLGSLVNHGTIHAQQTAIYAEYGIVSLSNTGLISSLHEQGVFANQSIGSLVNTGTITAVSSAVYDNEGIGRLSNMGVISSSNGLGIYTDDAIGSLVNSGTITSKSLAVYTNNGIATLNNGGVIKGGGDGIVAYGAIETLKNTGTIFGVTETAIYTSYDINLLTNSGLIQGASFAICVEDGGAIIHNAAQGTISGEIYLNDISTVVNAGTLTSSVDALVFAATGSQLVLDPSSVVVGTVVGDQGTLDMSGTGGTLDDLGTQYTGFATLIVNQAASWSLGGSSTIDAGAVLSDFGQLSAGGDVTDNGTIVVDQGAVLTLGGTTSGSGSLTLDSGATVADNGTLAVPLTFAAAGTSELLSIGIGASVTGAISGFAAGATIDLQNVVADTPVFADGTLTVQEGSDPTALATLQFAGSYVSGNFTLTSGGSGGTDITYAAVAGPDLAHAPAGPSLLGGGAPSMLAAHVDHLMIVGSHP